MDLNCTTNPQQLEVMEFGFIPDLPTPSAPRMAMLNSGRSLVGSDDEDVDDCGDTVVPALTALLTPVNNWRL